MLMPFASSRFPFLNCPEGKIIFIIKQHEMFIIIQTGYMKPIILYVSLIYMIVYLVGNK